MKKKILSLFLSLFLFVPFVLCSCTPKEEAKKPEPPSAAQVAFNNAYNNTKNSEKIYANYAISTTIGDDVENDSIEMYYEDGLVYTYHETTVDYDFEKTWTFEGDDYTYIQNKKSNKNSFTKVKNEHVDDSVFTIDDLDDINFKDATFESAEEFDTITFVEEMNLFDEYGFTLKNVEIQIKNDFITNFNVTITIEDDTEVSESSTDVELFYDDEITTEIFTPSQFDSEENWIDVEELVATAYEGVVTSEKVKKLVTNWVTEETTCWFGASGVFHSTYYPYGSQDRNNFTDTWQNYNEGIIYTYTLDSANPTIEEPNPKNIYKSRAIKEEDILEVAISDYYTTRVTIEKGDVPENDAYFVTFVNDETTYNLTIYGNSLAKVEKMQTNDQSLSIPEWTVNYYYNEKINEFEYANGFKEFPEGCDWIFEDAE